MKRQSEKPRPLGKHPFFAHEGVLAFAHRGGGGLWPQNTLYAFERAVEQGVDVLELDIHATKDGELVVIHDPVVDETTGGVGAVKDFRLVDLKNLDAGYCWTKDGNSYPFRGHGIKIPTLSEVFEAFPDIRINIDIKPGNPGVVAPLAEMLGRYNREQQVMVGSFHERQLALFRKICPKTATAATPGETRLFYVASTFFRLGSIYNPPAAAFQIPEYAGRLQVVTPRFIKAAHAHGIQVHVWTVDEVADMERLIAWGVDGLISDYPDRLIKVLGRA
jgi:glycerophosphoryl diester phosphodiesterase